MLWYKSGTEWRKKHLPALRLPRLPGQRPQPGTARPLPLQNDHIRHFSAQPIIYPLNSIKRFPAPVSAPQAYYDCCHSHMWISDIKRDTSSCVCEPAAKGEIPPICVCELRFNCEKQGILHLLTASRHRKFMAFQILAFVNLILDIARIWVYYISKGTL